MARIMKSFRLDSKCIEQLKYLQKYYKCSQSHIIEITINNIYNFFKDDESDETTQNTTLTNS